MRAKRENSEASKSERLQKLIENLNTAYLEGKEKANEEPIEENEPLWRRYLCCCRK